MSANAKDMTTKRIPGTLDGKLPAETLDAFEKRVGEDIPEATAEDFARARPVEDFPNLLEALNNARARGQRGPQKSETKDRVGLRIDHDVIEYFRSTGPGWQGRINAVLADYVKRTAR